MRSQLLALSFDTPASPWMTLKSARSSDARAQGWGIAWYPVDDNAAMVIKDPRATRDTALTEQLGDWERFRSTVFLCHIRGAAKRVTQQDTHPFARSYAGRNFIFAHSGDLEGDFHRALPLGERPVFEPLGRTDSEHAFCWLLTRLREHGGRTLRDIGWPTLQGYLGEIDRLGTANILLTDGQHLIAYRDEGGASELHWQRRLPPSADSQLSNSVIDLDLSDPLDHSRSVVMVSTMPLGGGEWNAMAPGQMLVVARAAVVFLGTAGVAQAAPDAAAPVGIARNAPIAVAMTGPGPAAGLAGLPAASPPSQVALAVPATAVATAPAAPETPAEPPRDLDHECTLSVVHATTYRYETPVESSSHILRLQPVHDLGQEIIDCELEISPAVVLHRFDDVFGNHTVELEIREPYDELRIVSRFMVRIRPTRGMMSLGQTAAIPLVWMPWQRQMMSPYLLPTELPESQLRELSDYAMSFVERQGYDLIESLRDLNESIYRDYRYISGSTTLETTPFEVYVHRRGVCQDFANLFICLARLLGIPARYRVGYIYTGSHYENKVQSEASHAWAEVYLPRLGWRGFDPTNGCIVGPHHVRVAVGRNYRDATPTAGTIFRGGEGEKLRVEVKVERRW